MRKIVLIILSVMLVLAAGCSASPSSEDEHDPTDYPYGKYQRSTLCHDNKLYSFVDLTGKPAFLGELHQIGTVQKICGAEVYPDEELEASNLEAGLNVYETTQGEYCILVERADEFQVFRLKE